MVFDTLAHASVYVSLLPGLAAAFDFLKKSTTPTLDDGRYPIDGDRVFALVQTYETRPVAEGLPEAHRRYADVQALLCGNEWIGYAPLRGQPVAQPYDPERDVLFVRGETTLCPLTPGVFALLLPQDAHLPGRTLGVPERVRKVVVKILLPDASRA